MMKRLFLFIILIAFLPTPVSASKDGDVEILVTTGDNLINICKKYLDDPSKWREVARINHLRNVDLLYPGQKLRIPVDLFQGLPLNGMVTFVKGDVRVYIRSLEIWRDLLLNNQITQGNRIRTGNESSVEITFEDGVSFLLRSNTSLEISSARKKSAINRGYRLFLDAGRVLSDLKKITGHESRFKIHTPSAIAGARGTEFRLSVDGELITRCEVLEGQVKIESEKKELDVREGEGILIKREEPPAEPSKLLLPPCVTEPKTIYRYMPVELAFERREGALFYRVLLSKERTFKDILKEQVIRPEETLKIAGLKDGTYFLQTRAMDKLGLEGFPSDPYTIKVRVNPLPPFIQSPIDGAQYRDRAVQFRWLRVQDAVQYHVQVAEDPDFKMMKEENKNVKDSSFGIDALDFKTYYFRARSIASDGYEGIWSDTLNFEIIPPPASPPVEAPKMGKDVVNIRWRNLGKNIAYHFQMAKDPAFENIIIDKILEKPDITFKRPDEAGQYYCRTSAMDSEGYEGDFSLPQVFEIEKKEFPYATIGVILTAILAIIIF